MRNALLILFLGLAAGFGAHEGWFALRHPATGNNPAAPLAWMESDLQLTPAQFARIKAIHEQSGPQLLALSSRAARMRAELENFEQVRRTDGRVDFLEFARFVEERRTIDRLWLDSTRQLIAATAGELTPAQRQRYLALLPPATARALN
jgi:hypothetical protein